MIRSCIYVITGLLFLFHLNVVFSQTVGSDPYKPQLKSYTPSTPNTASLGKFGEFPVDFSSGLVNISIPLYEIKSSKLSLPISLNYHASGIKPGDQASCVGLGWALNAGGVLSRSVRDKIDEFIGYLTPNSIIKSPGILNPNYSLADFDYLKSFTQTTVDFGMQDAEPDVFSYTLQNKSGQFFFSKDKVSTITMPFDKVNISYNKSGSTFSDFTIIDTDGTLYKYGKALDGTSYVESVNTPTGFGGADTYATNSWLLTAIVSADKSDTIQFTYSSDLINYDYGVTDRLEIYDEHSGQAFNPEYNSGQSYAWPASTWGLHPATSTTLHFNGMQQTIDQITFKNGKVVFEKDARTDGQLGQKINRISVYRLDAISNVYTKVKSLSFSYDYFSGYARLKLNQLSINDQVDNAVQKYSFTYNTSITVPSPNTRAIDTWGYYNGQSGNVTLLSQAYVDASVTAGTGDLTGTVGYSNRTPDINFAQACTLTSINYPTGGRTDFVYELNKYSQANLPVLAGGLRIKQINNYEANGKVPIVKTYTYGQNEDGTGILETYINYWSNYLTQYFLYWWDPVISSQPVETIRVRNFTSSPLTGLTGNDGRIVYYKYVTEYNGTVTNNTGKTVYQYDYTPDTYSNYFPQFGKFYRQNYSWKRGHLVAKSTVDAIGKTVQSTNYYYDQINQQYFTDVGYVISANNHFGGGASTALCSDTCTRLDSWNMYNYNTFSVETGIVKLTKTVDYSYDQADNNRVSSNETDYEYDTNNFEPSQIKKYSNNNYEVVKNTYPLNYNTSVTTTDPFILGLQNLKGINNINQIIETYKQKYKLDNTYIGTTDAVLTQFRSDLPYPAVIYKMERTSPNSGFIPSSITGAVFSKDANYQPYIQFNIYQNGNVVQQQKVNDVYHSYIWDYKNALPVAEVVNSSSSDIAYTSFEADGLGNWVGLAPSSIQPNGIAVTGKNSYSFGSPGTIVKTGLNSGNTYIVSYWSTLSTPFTTSPVSVYGYPQSLNTFTSNGTTWYYYEHKITGASSITLYGGALCNIDELRLYPSTAQMNTYTYTPLIGLSSKSDINGRTSYYEYDAFGRLKLIRDLNGNILKTFSYQYQSVTP